MWRAHPDRPALGSRRQKNTEPPAQAWRGNTACAWKRHANHSPRLPASRRAAVSGPAFGQPANAGQPLPSASAAARRDADGIVGCRDMQAASKHGFWARIGLHRSGMATTPWQPAPDMVAAPLKRRPHGAVPGQVIVDPRASHG